jgi:hypothetical protein
VFVPIFRPAVLPRSAPIAVLDVDRPPPVQEEQIRATIAEDLILLRPQQVNVLTYQPDPALNNVSYGFRLGGRVLGQDVSLSYFHGRFGIPTPVVTLLDLQSHVANVGVTWPRMDVLGADIAGSIGWLHGLGYWIEGAVTFPQATEFALYEDIGTNRYEERFTIKKSADLATQLPALLGPGGYLTAPQGSRATNISGTPFFKLTIGGDYSIGSHVYINAQYVHGFIDEFGAGVVARPKKNPSDPGELPRVEQRIGDYLVAGADVKLASDTLLLRFFGVLKVPSIDWETKSFDPWAFTMVLFPQVAYTVWDGAELSLGAFVYLGDRTTKFGDPAAGASELFTKAKFQW